MQRFWDKVDKTDNCWNWTAAKSNFGHGRFKLDGKLQSPHRLVYKWENGDIPEDMFICHTCDNPSCVNPEHLFLGTRSDNMKDAYDKGRIPHFSSLWDKAQKGENNGQSKLKSKQVLEIVAKHKTGNYSYRKLAKEYLVGRDAIYKIMKGKTWGHLTNISI